MQINITHTITLAPEVLSLLHAFLGKSQATPAAAGSAPSAKAQAQAVAKVETKAAPEPVQEQAPEAAPAKAQAQAADTATKATVVTLEQVRDVVQRKALAGKREDVKAILTAFGAPNVTSLDKAVYGEFLDQVNAL
jgi:predicted lipid-binding transport protein (Tim44 family)